MDEQLRKLTYEKHGRERSIVDALLRRLQAKDVVVSKSECPDFRLERNGVALGLELTEFFSDAEDGGSNTMRIRSDLERIASKRRELGHCLYVEVSGSMDDLSSSWLSLRNRLLDDEPQKGCRKEVLGGVTLEWRELDNKPRVWWTGLRSGHLPCQGEIKRRIGSQIEDKKTKGSNYNLINANALVLLLYSVPLVLGGTVDVDERVLRMATTDPFDDILFFNAFSEEIWTCSNEPRLFVNPQKRTIHPSAVSDATRSVLFDI